MPDGQTDRALLDTLLTVLPEFDIHPVEARKESTGFIFNRVWTAIKRESLTVVAEGVARPQDVDGMFKVNWHMPVGPFQNRRRSFAQRIHSELTRLPTQSRRRMQPCPMWLSKTRKLSHTRHRAPARSGAMVRSSPRTSSCCSVRRVISRSAN
jgi:hypothetical protein